MFPSPKAHISGWVISYILSGNLSQKKCQTVPWNVEEDYKKFEYTTVLIRSHQSEDRQDDGRKENDRMTNND